MFVPKSKYPFAYSTLALAVFGAVPAASQPGANTIEEVVVTAQKRAQSAQDIGLSVAALSGEKMRELRITQAEDLAQVIPNVSSLNVSGGGVPIIIVRGVGLQNFRINDSPTTAIYVDDVYQTSVATAEISMFDLERIELLKGPQSGFYGRNTISGALQVISAKPDVDAAPSGYARLEYGQFNRVRAEGAYSQAVGDSSAVRVAGLWERSDDTQWKNIQTGEEHGELDRWAARALFRFTPSENIDVMFKVHGGGDQSELPLMRALPVLADLGTAAEAGLPIPNAENIGLASFGPTACSSVLAGNGVSPSCATNTSITNLEYGLGDGDDDRFDSISNRFGFLDNSWEGVSLNAAFSRGDFTLNSVTAYDTLDYRRLTDLDSLPIAWAEADYGSEIDAWSQEFRLLYDGGDDVTWVAGLNYAEDDLVEDTIFDASEGAFPVILGGAANIRQDYEQNTKSFAVYGHLEWQFTETLNWVIEARYTEVEKRFDAQEYLGFPDSSEVPFVSAMNDVDFDNLSGKLALEWKVSDDALLYGSVSSGFKTGGFNGGVVFSAASLEPYQEETIMAYEIGAKTEWADGTVRLNGALFHYNREDVQQSATDINGEISITRLTNVGDVEVSGAELDLTWQATTNLSLLVNLGWTDSELVDSDLFSATVPGVPFSPIEGTNTPNYSKFSSNFIGRYERSLNESLFGWAQIEYSYRTDRDLNLIANSVERAVLREDGYGLANIRVGVGPENGQWEAALFVENVADESYRVLARVNGLRGLQTLYGDPRIWGLAVNYNFGS